MTWQPKKVCTKCGRYTGDPKDADKSWRWEKSDIGWDHRYCNDAEKKPNPEGYRMPLEWWERVRSFPTPLALTSAARVVIEKNHAKYPEKRDNQLSDPIWYADYWSLPEEKRDEKAKDYRIHELENKVEGLRYEVEHYATELNLLRRTSLSEKLVDIVEYESSMVGALDTFQRWFVDYEETDWLAVMKFIIRECYGEDEIRGLMEAIEEEYKPDTGGWW